MLQVRENEIPLRKWSRGTAHLRTLEGALTLQSWRQVGLLLWPDVSDENALHIRYKRLLAKAFFRFRSVFLGSISAIRIRKRHKMKKIALVIRILTRS